MYISKETVFIFNAVSYFVTAEHIALVCFLLSCLMPLIEYVVTLISLALIFSALFVNGMLDGETLLFWSSTLLGAVDVPRMRSRNISMSKEWPFAENNLSLLVWQVYGNTLATDNSILLIMHRPPKNSINTF